MTTPPPKIDWNCMLDVQQEIHRWASEQFPHRTAFMALSKLVLHEIPELLTHEKERGLATIGTELADCFILLMDLACIWGVELDDAIYEKMQINYRRKWTQGDGGLMQHIPGADVEPPRHTVYCPFCRSCSHTRPLELDDPIHPDIKIGSVETHDTFCTSCRKGFDSSVPF